MSDQTQKTPKWGFMASLEHRASAGPFPVRGSGVDELPGILSLAQQYGATNVDLLLSSADQIPDPAEVLRQYSDKGIALSAIGTGGIVAKNPTWRLTNPCKEIRKQLLAQLYDMVDLFDLENMLEKPAIIIGSVAGFCWDKMHEDCLERDRALSLLAEGMKKVLEHAAEANVPVLFELMNLADSNLFFSPPQFQEWADKAFHDCPKPSLLFDFYHACGGWTATDFQAVTLPIEYVHVVGKGRSPISNDSAGDHCHSFVAMLKRQGYQGPFIAECNPDPSVGKALEITKEWVFANFGQGAAA